MTAVVVLTMNAASNPDRLNSSGRCRTTGKPVVVAAVRNPYDIAEFPDVPSYVATYSYKDVALESLTRVLFGEVSPTGSCRSTCPADRPVAGAVPVRQRADAAHEPGARSTDPTDDRTDRAARPRPRGFLGALGAAAAGVAVGPRLAGAASAATAPSGGQPVRTGVQELIASGYDVLRGQKVGIVTNPTGVLPDLTHEVDVMAASDQVDLVAVFGPEHGFRGTAQAGGSEGSYVDERTGLTVWDTYLKSGDALADIVRRSGVDTMVFDIQDAGARFYTYIWTMYDCMVAAAVTGKRFVVLDRPNPTTGRTPRGPVLDRAFATFVGRREICQQHAMTVGELALLFAAEYLPDETEQPLQVDVVRMRGWDRRQAYADTGLPWILPSPNMPTPDTALVYPGTCMFEGTNLSEGRGPLGRSSWSARRTSTSGGRASCARKDTRAC